MLFRPWAGIWTIGGGATTQGGPGLAVCGNSGEGRCAGFGFGSWYGSWGVWQLGQCVPAELSRHCLCEGECRDPGPGLVIIGVVLVRVTLGSRLYTGDGQSK